MPEEIDDIEELIKKIQNKNLRIIAIDGPTGGGKTTLACNLKKKLGSKVEVINLDLFLRRGVGLFRFKVGILRNILKEIVNSGEESLIIIEGVLMREVMQKLRRATNHKVKDQEICHIYCMMKDTPDASYDDCMYADIESARIRNNSSTIQLVSYQRKFDPRANADYLFIDVKNG